MQGTFRFSDGRDMAVQMVRSLLHLPVYLLGWSWPSVGYWAYIATRVL